MPPTTSQPRSPERSLFGIARNKVALIAGIGATTLTGGLVADVRLSDASNLTHENGQTPSLFSEQPSKVTDPLVTNFEKQISVGLSSDDVLANYSKLNMPKCAKRAQQAPLNPTVAAKEFKNNWITLKGKRYDNKTAVRFNWWLHNGAKYCVLRATGDRQFLPKPTRLSKKSGSYYNPNTSSKTGLDQLVVYYTTPTKK